MHNLFQPLSIHLAHLSWLSSLYLRIPMIKPTLLLALLLFGMIYSYFIQIEISNIKRVKNSQTQYSFTIYSKMNQNSKIAIFTNHQLKTVSCNNIESRFKYYEYYNYKKEEQVTLNLKRGENLCILTNNKACKNNNPSHSLPIFKQKISFLEYLTLFLLLMVPLLDILFRLLIWILNKIWRENNV